MAYQCEIKEQSAQPALSVRTRASVAELPALIEKTYGAIFQYLGELGESPAGPPFSAYYNMDMQNLDVEIGVPVAKKLAGKGEVQASEIPGGRAATCLHVGPYDKMQPAYQALMQWMGANGYEAKGVAYEVYLNDPAQSPPEEWQTLISFPLK